MKQRIVTGVVATIILIPFIILSDTVMMTIFSCLLALVAEYEMLGCIGTRKKPWIAAPAFLTALITPLTVRLASTTERYLSLIFFLFFSLLFYMLCLSVFAGQKAPLEETTMTAITTMYLSFSFASLILLRDLTNGLYCLLLAFLIPWSNDIFAYFFGVKFGKHKLIPAVSPKKTVEGSVAGIVFGTLAVVLYGFIVGRILEGIYEVTPNYLSLMIIGIVTSVVSQMGDLVASQIKRRYQIKDYGFIFPGHGGVLDRFDSILAAAPFIYILCSLSGFFALFF